MTIYHKHFLNMFYVCMLKNEVLFQDEYFLNAFWGYFMTFFPPFIQGMLLQRRMVFLSLFRMEMCAFMISLANSTCLMRKKIPVMVKVASLSEGLQSGEVYTSLNKCDSFLWNQSMMLDSVKMSIFTFSTMWDVWKSTNFILSNLWRSIS